MKLLSRIWTYALNNGQWSILSIIIINLSKTNYFYYFMLKVLELLPTISFLDALNTPFTVNLQATPSGYVKVFSSNPRIRCCQ